MLAAAFALVPSLVTDPLWEDAAWRPVADGAIDDAIQQPDRWLAMLVALESGRFDEARVIAREADAEADGLATLVVNAWSGDQTAFERLHDEARADPVDAELVGACRRLASMHDPDLATPGWACDGGWYFGDYLVASVGDGPVVGKLPGNDPYWHGAYAYRRPGPLELLVPGLLRIQTTID